MNIIKRISKRVWGKILIFWGKHRKVKNFSFPIEKEVTNIDKDGNDITVVTVSYKIKFIDSARFMAISLSNLADNLTEGIHKIKCKDCDYFLEYKGFNDNLMKYKSLSYNKDYSNKIYEKLKERLKNTFNFSNNGINKFILLLTLRVRTFF